LIFNIEAKMKAIILLSLVAATLASPRWNLLEDHFGKAHLIDVNPIDAEVDTFDASNDVFFMLYTRDSQTTGRRIEFDRNSILNANWNSAHDVRVLVHGFGASHTVIENVRTIPEFFRRGDYNVIAVDWSALATGTGAAARVPDVGAVIGRFIDFLFQEGLTQHSRVNIVGHSLGSHVSGFAGKNTAYGTINAIFATDPGAGMGDDPAGRLDSSDAFYVEAIITSSIGFRQPIAHATFYPNWGIAMPGCGINPNCNHHRATEFYTESVNSNRFMSRQCADLAEINAQNCPGTGVFATMGGDSAKPISGVFFLETNAASPFAQG
jgi:pancreatic triacylglycerol lipase